EEGGSMEKKATLRIKMMLAATALVVPMMSVSGASAAVTQEYLEDLCDRTLFYRNEVRRIQRSDDFPEIVEYTLANCPAVMAALTSQPTATINGERTERRDDKSRENVGSNETDGKKKVKDKKKKKKETKKEEKKEEPKEEEKKEETPGPGKKDGPGKREDGPGKREDGPGKREDGPGKREDGPGKREDGPGEREDGPGEQDSGGGEQAL
ncbi:MAG: hypothetical protein WBB85_18140, partial [Albidovulum sp.]